MTMTKLGMTPIEYPVGGGWTAWIPLLKNDKYGLMMIRKSVRPKVRRSVVIKGKEFDSPNDAFEFARKWHERETRK